jgi:hypothetical protein
MKYSLRRLSAVVVLALTLSVTALGGQMGVPVVDVPPPPPASQPVIVTEEETKTPANGTGMNQIPDEATTNPVAEIVLRIMQSVLSLV